MLAHRAARVVQSPADSDLGVPVATAALSESATDAGTERLKAQVATKAVVQDVALKQRASTSLSDTFANRDKEEAAVDKLFADLGSEL